MLSFDAEIKISNIKSKAILFCVLDKLTSFDDLVS